MSFDGFYISIHSLRMEGDISIKNMTANYPYFNPLPPYGGRPSCRLLDNPQDIISIHSLRMEGDISPHNITSTISYFNPLPPYGGRRGRRGRGTGRGGFQSTPSVWRETFSGTKTGLERRISIHSLRMEGDSITPLLYLSALIFQSTPSVWRETERHAL